MTHPSDDELPAELVPTDALPALRAADIASALAPAGEGREPVAANAEASPLVASADVPLGHRIVEFCAWVVSSNYRTNNAMRFFRLLVISAVLVLLLSLGILTLVPEARLVAAYCLGGAGTVATTAGAYLIRRRAAGSKTAGKRKPKRNGRSKQ